MDAQQQAYLDPTLAIEQRVDDLVSRMTLPEKVSQMVHDAPPIERLGIPKYNWWNECLHGVARAGVATVFPQAIGLAATWDVPLMARIATAISDEARAKHHEALRHNIREIYSGLTFWSPNINLFRDPRWGRGHETYGEDPYLTARMGVAFVKGLQGDDPRYLKLVATAKHYAVHSGPESLRHSFDARVDERDLRMTYLPAFEALIREAGAYSVMGAYNRTNGEACNASPTLLQRILREEWGFEGYVVSDCWAIKDIYKTHGLAADAPKAAALAVKAGCDVNCGEAFLNLQIAHRRGLIDEATIDRAVRRLFIARMRLGMFDPPEMVPYAAIPYAMNGAPEHRALSLQAARESIVLLKNADNLLPLRKDLASIAVIGPNADDPAALLGNYNGTPFDAVTPLEGIRRAVSPATTVYCARGCDLAEGYPTLTPIPPTYLRPDQADAGQIGLAAAYYDQADLRGEPVLRRVDPCVNFDWKSRSPLSGELGGHFGVVWSGALVPPVSGQYRLAVNAHSEYRLYLDEQLLAEYRGVHHALLRYRDLELEAGRLYNLRLEYASTTLDPRAQLLWAVPGGDPLAEAVAVAQQAEAVVVVLGLSSTIEGEEMPVHMQGFAGGDRTDIVLPSVQQQLLERIQALGKPTVLVLLTGSALAFPWAAEHVPAILTAWYPGEAGGTALADVLFGDYSPSGRLPVTFYRSLADLPDFEDYRMAGRTYRYFSGQPLYAFGHGLSYTSFRYTDLALSRQSIGRDGSVSVSVTVHNVGPRAGDEVVQLYVSDVQASVPVPIRQLAGIARVHLEAGQAQGVSFQVDARQLFLVDDAGQRTVEPGEFRVAVGGSQPRDEHDTNVLYATFAVEDGGR